MKYIYYQARLDYNYSYNVSYAQINMLTGQTVTGSRRDRYSGYTTKQGSF